MELSLPQHGRRKGCLFGVQFVYYGTVEQVRMAGRWLATLSPWPRAACPETRPLSPLSSAAFCFACPHLPHLSSFSTVLPSPPLFSFLLPSLLLLPFNTTSFPSSDSPPYLPFHLLVCSCSHRSHKLAFC